MPSRSICLDAGGLAYGEHPLIVSAAVRQEIRGLSEEALARGDGPAFVAAVKAFLARLAVCPQFGDPIIDLAQGGGQVRVGIIRPLSMRDGVHEDQRLVFCGAPPILLPLGNQDSTAKE